MVSAYGVEHLNDVIQIDFRSGITHQIFIENLIELRQKIIADCLSETKHFIFYQSGTVRDNDHNGFFINRNQLNGFNGSVFNGGNHPKGGKVGNVGKGRRNILNNVIQLSDFVEHGPAHLLDFSSSHPITFHQAVNIEAKSLTGRNPTGRGMRLYQKAHLLQIAHLVSNGSST